MNGDQKHKEIIEIHGKAENISSAVFLVSSAMSDGEELKTKIKDLALSLVGESSLLRKIPTAERVKNIYNLESIALNLSSLFHISSVSGAVSPMNSSVIREEIVVFIELLVSYTKSVHDCAVTLVRERVVISEGVLPVIPQTKQIPSSDTKSLNGRNNGLLKTTRKDTRERTILEFIRTKDSVNIKDISRNVRGCSEKTIQRELLKMVENGLVKKMGERRWSRYSYLPTGRQV